MAESFAASVESLTTPPNLREIITAVMGREGWDRIEDRPAIARDWFDLLPPYALSDAKDSIAFRTFAEGLDALVGRMASDPSFTVAEIEYTTGSSRYPTVCLTKASAQPARLRAL